MYLTQDVLPIFNQWVNSLATQVGLEDAEKYARYFISNNINPSKIKHRGEVYDLFEDVCKHAKIKQLLNAGQMNSADQLRTENLRVLAQGIIWAVEHDGFDTVKYDPITNWGMDITSMHSGQFT